MQQGKTMKPTVYLLLIDQGNHWNDDSESVFCGIYSTKEAAIARGEEIMGMIPDYHEAANASIGVYPFTLDEALPVKLSGVRETWAGSTPPIQCSFGPTGIQQSAIWYGRTFRMSFGGRDDRMTGRLT